MVRPMPIQASRVLRRSLGLRLHLAQRPVLGLRAPTCVPSFSSFASSRHQPEFHRATSTTATVGNGSGSVPVVLLSGFLGAGKTTLLEQLLRNNHGLKLGIIVNDLASVNVDAAVLNSAVLDSGAESIELSNGCVCCSAAGDLRRGILSLSAQARSKGSPLAAIVVELSGVAEPGAARAVLDDLHYISPAHVARTITVVDASAFAADFVAKIQTGDDAPSEQLSALLAEQIEEADLIVLNKVDAVAAAELQQARSIIAVLNDQAEISLTEYGNVQIDQLLPSKMLSLHASERDAAVEAKDPKHTEHLAHQDHHGHGHGGHGNHGHGHHGHDHGHDHSCEDAHCSHVYHDHRSSAERRFGIRSFVYTASRPFNRVRFVDLLQAWQKAWMAMGKRLQLLDMSVEALEDVNSQSVSTPSPLAPVLRSKGLLWLDAQPTDALYWSHAGRCVRFTTWGAWGEDANRHARSKGHNDVLDTPRIELVFIGANLEKDLTTAALDACLVNDEEWAQL